jgi:hypothetical protein
VYKKLTISIQMITKDKRRIISGHYSSEEERKSCLTEEQWIIWKNLEKEISERDTGTKEIVRGHNRNQQSIIGRQGDINPWGHSEGTIGNTIDYCMKSGVFTKKQIAILAGTNMNKINAHLKSMEKKELYKAIVKESEIVTMKEFKD